jgi:transcriptional regulator with XRE-family HTH domain
MGEKLKEAREAAGMSQTELAEAVGRHQKDISLYEKGQREPGALTLKKMAQALGCSMDELV